MTQILAHITTFGNLNLNLQKLDAAPKLLKLQNELLMGIIFQNKHPDHNHIC